MAISKRNTSVALALLGLSAAGLLLYSTRRGIGLSYDPVVYLGVASNLLRGRGLTYGSKTLTHFPPLYPLLLALAGRISGELDLGARLLNALLWGGNTLLAGLLVYRLTRGLAWLALISSVLVLLSPVMFDVHVEALSEPAFILLALLSLWLLQQHEERSRPWVLWASAALAGMAFLTRYVGGTLVVTGVVWLLTDRRQSVRSRWRNSLQFGSLAVLPMAVWMARGLAVAGTAADRKLYWHPAGPQHLTEALESLSTILAPGATGPALGVLVVAAFVAAVAWLLLARRRALQPDGASASDARGPLLYAAFAGLYVLGVTVSVSLFDALTPYSTRILSPVFVAMLITVLSTIGLATQGARPALRATSLLPLVLLASIYASATLPAAQDAHDNGLGWAHRRYQESEFARYIRALPEDTVLLTNNRSVLSLMTGRTGTQLAQKYNPLTLLPDARYPRLWQRTVADVRSKDGLVIFFSVEEPRQYQITLEELLEVARFEVVLQTEEGVVLRPLRRE